MPGDGFYFHDIEVGVFKQAGSGLVPQVVEGQIFDSGSFAGFHVGMGNRHCRHAEDRPVSFAVFKLSQNTDSGRGKRDSTFRLVFRPR